MSTQSVGRRRALPARRDERGLALLDVLLGMAIFALVAVIAVQAMGTFRERAYVTQATSDARQLATGIEAERIGQDAYPASIAADASDVDGVNLTTGTEVARFIPSSDGFQLCVVAKRDSGVVAHAIYNSVEGSIVEAGRGPGPAGCDPAPAAPPPPPVVPELLNGIRCPVITWGTPFVWNSTEYRVSAHYTEPTIARIMVIGGDATYIDQGAVRRHDFARATGVNWVNATMSVRGTNGLYRHDCTTSFTWPPD